MGHYSNFCYPFTHSKLGTSLSENFDWIFLKFGDSGLPNKFGSILGSYHSRRLGHSVQGVGPPPPLLGQCPKFVIFFEAFPKTLFHVIGKIKRLNSKLVRTSFLKNFRGQTDRQKDPASYQQKTYI